MIKRLLSGIAILLTIALFATSPYSGEIYKWRDSSGIIHYSDRKPDHAESESFEGVDSKADADAGPEPSPAVKEQPKKKSVEKESEKHPAGGGMFWKIECEEALPSYILGTIHSGDDRVMQLPETVDRRFNESDIFCMELLMDGSSLLKSTSAMFLSDGRKLKEILDEELYERTAEAMLKRGVGAGMLDMMKPWAVVVMLSAPDTGGGLFLDTMLQQRATQEDKEVHGLETPEEQLEVFNGMSMDDQVALLETTLDNLHKIPGLIEEMIQTYVADDLLKLAELGLAAMGGEEDVNEQFLKRINEDRNRLMVDRMMPRLEDGGAFIAVGALHLPF
ncbi:MAG: DUF4124 domain-containing protein, partial [Desulfobacterales bacterium]|nr:DUF4124 domain-containing protein [Desulfobacterales bacterium]